MKLFINPNSPATDSLTASLDDQAAVTIPPLFFGDHLPLDITIHDGTGSLPGNYAESTLKVAIGTFTDNTPLLEVEKTLAPGELTAKFNIDLRGQNFDDLTLNQESVAVIFEVESTLGNITKTIHQSRVEVRNQILSQQIVNLTLPLAPSEIEVEKLPLPDDPSNVTAAADPDAPSNVVVTMQQEPDAPSNVTAGELPAAPSEVEAATNIAEDATPSNVVATTAQTWSWFGTNVASPLKIKVVETSPGSLDGTNAELLKGRTFIWDGVETYEPSHHFGGNSYQGSPVWRSGGEEPGTLANPTDMTAEDAFNNGVFRLFAQDINGTEIQWRLQYARPQGKWTGGLIGQTNFNIQRSDGHDPSFYNGSVFNLRPGENEPLAPSEVELNTIGTPSNVQVFTTPAAPSNVVIGAAPQAPSNVLGIDLCYHIDNSGVIGLGSYIIAISNFALSNGQTAKPGEIFRVNTYATSGNLNISSLEDSSRTGNINPGEFNPGDQIVATKYFTKRNGEVVINPGDVYEVVRVSSAGVPIINTNPQVGLGANELQHFQIGYNGAWHLLRMENCSGITNIEVKVQAASPSPVDGYYQVINPQPGYYEDPNTFKLALGNTSGASLYKKVRNLDCTIPGGNYYIYRNMRTGSDYIYYEFRGHTSIATGNTTQGVPLASAYYGALEDLAIATAVPANVCQTFDIAYRYQRINPPANSNWRLEGYYALYESRPGWYEEDGTFTYSTITPDGTQPIVGASAYKMVRDKDCVSVERQLTSDEMDLTPASQPGVNFTPTYIYRSRKIYAAGHFMGNQIPGADSNSTAWSFGYSTKYLHMNGTITGGGLIPYSQYVQVAQHDTATWTAVAANACG